LAAGAVDIISPLILHGDRSAPLIDFAGGHIDWRRGATIHVLRGKPASAAGSGLRPTTFVTGAAPMMKAETWKALSGFREDYFLYWEDADLSLRAERLGLRSAVDLDAPAWHSDSGSSDEDGRSRSYYWHIARNRERFLREWTPSPLSLRDRLIREGETLRWIRRALLERHQPLQKVYSLVSGRLSAARVASGLASEQMATARLKRSRHGR
jgi:N-acetylglucosaminyl-diphospho-decaprenol L-rhamnosyltransferase